MTICPATKVRTVTTRSTGLQAEQAAAEYLQASGFQVVQQNYRRPHCEVDIVAAKEGRIFFVEVKYRASHRFGRGLDYITPWKIHHMVRGAETWVRDYKWTGPYQLSAIEVSGPLFEITDFIEDL